MASRPSAWGRVAPVGTWVPGAEGCRATGGRTKMLGRVLDFHGFSDSDLACGFQLSNL